ncbi:hypothetical protein ACPUEN_09455 [Algoriphagus yeomjeoni]|uniref:hypothetical protein n=1 Tax=Algoriphagus yeomjeoni TaxID=291403 RepID=UPI003CE5BEC7
MKTLLRIYLILIFAGSALNAGSDNDSIAKKSGFMIEGSNFTTKSIYPQNLKGIAECINSAGNEEYIKIKEAMGEQGSAAKSVN